MFFDFLHELDWIKGIKGGNLPKQFFKEKFFLTKYLREKWFLIKEQLDYGIIFVRSM